MSLLRTKFEKQEFYYRLGKRALGFSLCMDYLSQSENPLIIETGSIRIPDNWEGDGQSTLIWQWVKEQIPTTKVHSIDISPEACRFAKKFAPSIDVVCSDSVTYLNSLGSEILSHVTLLYLDSFNWSLENQLASGFHHFAELAAVWRLLPKGCLVMVDDRHCENKGKHIIIQEFMNILRIPPRYEGYQIAWLKP